MHIITPTAENAEEITSLLCETWMATYPNPEAGISFDDVAGLMERWSSPEGTESRKKFYEELPNKPEIYNRIAVLDEKIVGYCAGFENEERVHLKSLYVLPAYQGRGIGAMLFQDFISWANPDKPTTLHVVDYNTKAIAFYEKMGFVDTGKRFEEERFRMKSGAIFTEMEMVRK